MDVEQQPAAAAAAPAPEAEDDEDKPTEQVPDMAVAQLAFVVTSGRGTQDDAKAAMDIITAKNMAPFYKALCAKSPQHFALDDALLQRMEAENAKTLAEIDAAQEMAEKDSGDVEVLDAMFARAAHYARIGDRDAALAAHKAIVERAKISTGRRIDAAMATVRVGLFHSDMPAVKEALASAKKLVEAGGDWDRRNRLKVYEAFYLVLARDMKGAAALLLECVATFTCTELCSYEEFIFVAVVTNVLCLPRTDLKKKIVDGPEVLGVLPSLPHLQALVASLYNCDYRGFMAAMVEVNEQLLSDRYFAQHARYMVKELRILAYAQYLEAYRSVVLASMARAFGVGVDFLDAELSRFIAAARLNAQIDKVGGVVETNRPDKKNAQYQAAIKQGDLLLNKIQKLARVTDV
ncbi:26S proteasome subunit RPN7-domain-containing protein [Tribonema minus]|uniref:26S proteasome subunit RPN7-domain-containing protein n=1 Tax=Tribonema minus TaxID=303371 RepID=A0A835Z177_9STRA|nr:26S proteasome subunit RPN7-domain-containing protein [Tribonema minus]